MANISITNNDLGSVELADGEFRDDTVVFAGADTFYEGTILARTVGGGNDDKLVLFVNGGVATTNGTPAAVLTKDLVATGAGDEVTRVLVAGKVRKEKLRIDPATDDTGIDNDVIDQLRRTGIIPIDTKELNIVDTQD